MGGLGAITMDYTSYGTVHNSVPAGTKHCLKLACCALASPSGSEYAQNVPLLTLEYVQHVPCSSLRTSNFQLLPTCAVLGYIHAYHRPGLWWTSVLRVNT